MKKLSFFLFALGMGISSAFAGTEECYQVCYAQYDDCMTRTYLPYGYCNLRSAMCMSDCNGDVYGQ
jgi:hypothetical protein